jgi:hypothetical protein
MHEIPPLVEILILPHPTISHEFAIGTPGTMM